MIQPAASTLSRGRWLVAWAAALLAAIGSITVWLSAAARDQPGAFDFDVVIRNGDVYDGTGRPARRVDVGLRGDRIARLGNLQGARSRHTIDATGLAVAPGFINMLSWSTESLLTDGRAQSTIRQGVTTEIMGEGTSMGPLNAAMKARMLAAQRTDDPTTPSPSFAITWTTLSEYLWELERRGVSANVASFIGAATIREHVIGLENRPATPAELSAMRALVEREMAAGALGIGSALIYAPGAYASTAELIELCRVAARAGGRYISHIRSEGRRLLEAIDELVHISREAGLPAEVYHLKAAGRENWPKMDAALARIEQARRAGLAITADMYLYEAGATGLDATIPPSAFDGGLDALLARLAEPAQRGAIALAMRTPSDAWENLYRAAGSPDRVLLVGFRSEGLRPLIGRTLGAIADARGRDPVDTILDLVAEDRGSPSAVYFLMSENNIRKQLARPWVSIGSDAAAIAPEGVFLRSAVHPRAYGNFARLLGKYVREERVIGLAEAIRRMTGLPATNLALDRRGFLRPGYFADVVVFDPQAVADRATYEAPHQYSVGVEHVFVNGTAVLRSGAHTGATPGRALRGRGKKATRDGKYESTRYEIRGEPRSASLDSCDSLSMHREHHRWHSWNLGWEMGVTIYGHYGSPLLFFPTSLGDEWEQDGQGMIRTLTPFIEGGRIKVFCVRSSTREGLYNKQAHPFHRSWVLRNYDAYIRQEVIPFIHHHCHGLPPVAVMGASLGAFHAANTILKYPDAVKRCFALSGIYDMRDSMSGMYDDNFYFNNPVDYVPNLSDPWTYVNLETCDIHIATGSGPYENSGPSYHFASLLKSKGIPHSLDDWGPKGGHDWPYWHHQMWSYCEQLY